VSGAETITVVALVVSVGTSIFVIGSSVKDERELDAKCAPFVRETSFVSDKTRHIVCRDVDGGFQIRAVKP
jgi:hypothetical protein